MVPMLETSNPPSAFGAIYFFHFIWFSSQPDDNEYFFPGLPVNIYDADDIAHALMYFLA